MMSKANRVKLRRGKLKLIEIDKFPWNKQHSRLKSIRMSSNLVRCRSKRALVISKTYLFQLIKYSKKICRKLSFVSVKYLENDIGKHNYSYKIVRTKQTRKKTSHLPAQRKVKHSKNFKIPWLTFSFSLSYSHLLKPKNIKYYYTTENILCLLSITQ